MSNPIKAERRSRRTHKNSKDGCPNCRANRIKCSEDLPVCANCIKKNLRCGYLDFSPEKLEHIRRKNALNAQFDQDGLMHMHMRSINDPTSVSNVPEPCFYDNPGSLFKAPQQYHEAPMQLTESAHPHVESSQHHMESSQHLVESSQHHMESHMESALPYSPQSYPVPSRYAHSSVKKPPHRRAKPEMPRQMSSDLRSKVYSRVFSRLAPDFEGLAPRSKNPMDQFLESTQLGPWTPGDTSTYPDLLVLVSTSEAASHDHRQNALRQPLSRQMCSLGSEPLVSDSSLHTDSTVRSSSATPSRGISRPQSTSGPKNGLPNCINIKKSFPQLTVPTYLSTSIYPNQCLRESGPLSAAVDSESPVTRPIYFEADSRAYWLDVFSKATHFSLFFLNFIDESLNILMRASEGVVNGDIISTPPGDSSESSEGNFFSFFYNNHDLETLTRKSFVTYGKVIRELRKSITSFDPEYPARMSLFSARACYMNPATDFKTCLLMMSGTLVLFKNILSNIQTQQAEHNIPRDLLMLNYLSNMSVCPDYNYEVVLDLKQSFARYKAFVDQLAADRSGDCDIEHGVERVLKDPLFMHNCHELDKYFTKLETYFFPMIKQCNDYFNNFGKEPDKSAVRFISPTLLFDMMYEWFKIYPGERMLMGTKIHPLKKIIFLFFHALGKTLNHVLTPIKAVLFVDPCNIMFTKVGMQFFKLDGCDSGPCSKLVPVVASIYRTIRYFESRSMLYAYCMDDSTVLEREYIRSVATHAPKAWDYRDVIRISPEKIRSEAQLTRFSSGYFRVENFAFLEPLLSNPTCAELIAQEIARQKFALANEPYFFNFDLGLSNHDFNPELIIDCYVSHRNEQLKSRGHLPVDTAKARVETLIQAHAQIDLAAKLAAETK